MQSKTVLPCAAASKLAACLMLAALPHGATLAGELDATPAGWTPGKSRFDAWKFKDEKPLLTISSENLAQHVSKLSPGQIELFKTVPGYKMVIYPTHNSCGYPDWYQQNTKANKGKAKLDPTNNYLVDAVLPGRVFDEPASGAEAMWNWETRYQGVGVKYQWRTYISPAPGGTDAIINENIGSQFLPWGKKGATSPSQVSDVLNANWLKVISPPALAGQGGAFRTNFQKPGEAYYYFTGQRRVRRMPTYTYDAPQIGYENQYTVDDVFLFYGAIDRFDWKLAGRKTIYVPYNSFAMHKNKDEFNKAVTPKFINPEYRRYEAHEVAVVEGTLKSSVRHIASKKVFYFDLDTWNILAGEDYDAQGKLFKYREGYTLPVWELGGVCSGVVTYQHNFQSGRYVADNLLFGQKGDAQFYDTPGKNIEFTLDYYSANGLQSASER